MSAPEPRFAVTGAAPVEFAAVPTLAFDLEVTDASDREIFTVALTCQINIDPARREYDPETRGRLIELFGEPGRWAQTTRSFRWLQSSVLVPAFRSSATFQLPVLCNFDVELAATKYFHSLPDGEIPLTFLFSGTTLYRGDAGEVQGAQVSWENHSSYRLPVAVWKQLMAHYYPQTGWVGMHTDTLAALGRYKAERGLPTFDACISELLATPVAGTEPPARVGD